MTTPELLILTLRACPKCGKTSHVQQDAYGVFFEKCASCLWQMHTTPATFEKMHARDLEHVRELTMRRLGSYMDALTAHAYEKRDMEAHGHGWHTLVKVSELRGELRINEAPKEVKKETLWRPCKYGCGASVTLRGVVPYNVVDGKRHRCAGGKDA